MSKLILSIENKVIEEFPIEKDLITIGRREDNDICLDNLSISGYHTQITSVLNDCFVEDLNSTNGTFVNSKIVRKHALKDGDIIDIGNHRIKYINHLASNSANNDFEKTVVMEPNIQQDNLDKSIAAIENQIESINSNKNEAETEDNDIPGGDIVVDDDSLDTGIKSLSEQLDENANKEEAENIKNKLGKASQEFEDNENNSTNIEEKSEKEIEAASDELVTEDQPVEKAETEVKTETEVEPEVKIETKNETASDKIGHIQILNGNNAGKELTLDKSLTTLGKPNLAVVGISKRNDGYHVMHIEGDKDHPSKLNGEVLAGKAVLLEDHDILEIGGIKLEFFVE